MAGKPRRSGGRKVKLPPAVETKLGRAIPGFRSPTARAGGGGGGAPPGGRPRGGPPGSGPGGPRRGPGGSGPPGGGGGPPRGTSGSAPDPDHFNSVAPGWDRVHRSDAPQSVQDASRGFQPRVAGDRRPTTGSYRSAGDANSTDISSGRDPSLSQDLDHSRINSQSGRPLPVAPESFDHAEARPAQQMRTDGRDTEVVVDNTTCGSRTFDSNSPTSCDTLLPGMIPADSRMTVWGSVDGGQTFFRRVIDGTGSLIR